MKSILNPETDAFEWVIIGTVPFAAGKCRYTGERAECGGCLLKAACPGAVKDDAEQTPVYRLTRLYPFERLLDFVAIYDK